MVSENTPLVSIVCITYNHASYIRDAIEGFLRQKTNFDIEILIHDDASTDDTANIIREYEKKDKRIKAIYQTENQYSKGINPCVEYVFSVAKGKYIAFCEGDDYWTDPYKLQKQVDLMDRNPVYVACFHGYEIFNGLENTGTFNKKSNLLNNDINGFEFTSIFDSDVWITQPLTVLFKTEALKQITKCLNKYTFQRDVHLFYHLLNGRKAFYINQIMAVYRRHEGGMFSMIGKQDQLNVSYKIYKELFINNNNDARLKKVYLSLSAEIMALPSNKGELSKLKILLDVFSISIKDGVYLVVKGLKYIMKKYMGFNTLGISI